MKDTFNRGQKPAAFSVLCLIRGYNPFLFLNRNQGGVKVVCYAFLEFSLPLVTFILSLIHI